MAAGGSWLATDVLGHPDLACNIDAPRRTPDQQAAGKRFLGQNRFGRAARNGGQSFRPGSGSRPLVGGVSIGDAVWVIETGYVPACPALAAMRARRFSSATLLVRARCTDPPDSTVPPMPSAWETLSSGRSQPGVVNVSPGGLGTSSAGSRLIAASTGPPE